MKHCASRVDACLTSNLLRGNNELCKYSDTFLTIDSHGDALPIFHPEFGRFMLEATPGRPWGIGFKDLLDVEPNMKWRLVDLSNRYMKAHSDMVLQARDRDRPHGAE